MASACLEIPARSWPKSALSARGESSLGGGSNEITEPTRLTMEPITES